MYYPIFYDPTYFLVLIGIVLTMIVQGYMTATFNKYQNVMSRSGLTASEACKMILESNGINNVRIGHVTKCKINTSIASGNWHSGNGSL